MKQQYDLEISILSCLLQQPTLMNQLKLQDKHFIKQQRLWQFMKSFYKKFQTFDILLMYQVCRDKYKIIDYITWLVDVEPMLSNFDKYQDMLIKLYNQNKKEKWIIEKIYSLANDLYIGNIDLQKFKDSIEKTEKDANIIFKEGV